jgi:hypothetical protein
MADPKKKPVPPKAASPANFPPSADPLAVAPPAIANTAAVLAGFTPVMAPYDDIQAKELAETFRPRLAAIAAERIVTARLDVDAAARALLAVHAFVTQAPGVYAWFTSLHQAGQFDITNVDDLLRVSSVVLYAYREAAAAGAFKTSAKIPAALDEASAQLEREMQSVCEHNLGDNPEYGPLLDHLRPGTAYLDRADDMLGYAKIYEAEHALLSKDTKYKPTHVADARQLAGEIIAMLGASMTPKAREQYDLLQRAWTLLSKMYFEVQQAGLWLLRYDPQRDQRFPSVFAVGRPGSGRRRTTKPGDDAATTTPAGDPAGGATGV